MLFNSIKIVEGSEVNNLVIDSDVSFPINPIQGQLFYRTDNSNEGLYIYNGAVWIKQLGTGDSADAVLPNLGTPGTYKSVTTDAKGRVIAGTNPTTLAGYGITNAQPLDADLTAIANLSGASGLLKKTGTNTWTLDSTNYLTDNQSIILSGDATGFGTNDITVTLATTGVTAGTYGTGSTVPTTTVDTKGRVLSVLNTPIAIDASAVNSGTFANARIAASNVTQHQASLVLQGSQLTSGIIPDARLAASSIVQHQSALTITESQITDGSLLTRNSGNETVTGAWTFTAPITGASPTLGNHLTTKDYVDNVASGVSPHHSVKVATTTNITLSGTQTIDGIAVNPGDRVLVKDQSLGQFNGVYVVSAGTWARATDFDGSPAAEVQAGDLVYVESGTSSGNSSWILVTSNITLNVTPLVFSIFSRPGDFVAGNGMTKTGNTFNIGTGSATRIVINTDNIDLATIGTAGTYSSVTVDSYGRVSGGSVNQSWTTISGKPTTLAGYGITDGFSNAGGTVAGSILATLGFQTPDLTNVGLANASNTAKIYVNNTNNDIQLKTNTGGRIYADAPHHTWRAENSTTQYGTLDFGGLRLYSSTDNSRSIVHSVEDSSSTYPTAIYSSNQITTAGGYVRIGPTSALFTHYITDRPGHWFDKSITTAGDFVIGSSSYKFDASGNINAHNLVLDGTLSAPGGISGNSSTATTLATGRTFSVSGDATGTSGAFDGSANATIPVTLSSVGTAGTYRSVTTDAKGRVISGTNPTTAAGYGLTDVVTTTTSHSGDVSGTYNLLVLASVGTAGTYRSVTTDAKGRVISGTNPTTLAGYGITDALSVVTSMSGDVSGTYNSLVLASVGVAGTYRSVTTDAKGRVISGTNPTTASGYGLTDVVTTSTSHSGDVSGAYNALTLANSGVTAGTYKSVTVDLKGRVTAGTNPTTLAGYGITDAVSTVTSLSGDVSGTYNSLVLASVGTAGTYRSVTTDAKGRVISGTNPTTLGGYGITDAVSVTQPHSGDVSGTYNTMTLASVGTAGTYRSVTTDAKGRVISGTNPTTLAGYGITDGISNAATTAALYAKGNGPGVGSDWNSFTTAGIYSVTVSDGWTTGGNGPGHAVSSTIYGYGQLLVSSNGGNVIQQTYYVHGTGLYYRCKFNAVDWSQWNKMSIVNPSGIPTDGDIKTVGSVISIYAGGAWRQIYPAVYQ